MVSLDDTIVAISTPLGEGGIGIVRMSGPGAPAILRRVFVPKLLEGRGLETTDEGRAYARIFEPWRLYYGHVIEPSDGELIDEALAVHMPRPRTYTRQDVVEIDAHGGVMAVQRILELCLAQGARLAEPGEFTLRAFLNGRLDLAQAEAVLDVVRARTGPALQTAVGQLTGRLSERIRLVRGSLLEALTYVEASIDFPEDEVPTPVQELATTLEQAAAEVDDLLASADRGIIYRQGVRVAIIGRPNVGKSSLLNRLLRTNRAIVTDIPGTTRDTVEESLNLSGVPVILVDTAGMGEESSDPIEQLGIERSRQALAGADLALLVLDASEPLSRADHEIMAALGDKPAIWIMNKIDLVTGVGTAIPRVEPGAGQAVVAASALTGEGIADVEAAIVHTVLSGQVAASGMPLVSNPRHKGVLSRAAGHIRAAQATLSSGLPVDLLAVDLSGAVRALGEITGQTAREELLDEIFRNFCIGK